MLISWSSVVSFACFPCSCVFSHALFHLDKQSVTVNSQLTGFIVISTCSIGLKASEKGQMVGNPAKTKATDNYPLPDTGQQLSVRTQRPYGLTYSSLSRFFLLFFSFYSLKKWSAVHKQTTHWCCCDEIENVASLFNRESETGPLRTVQFEFFLY